MTSAWAKSRGLGFEGGCLTQFLKQFGVVAGPLARKPLILIWNDLSSLLVLFDLFIVSAPHCPDRRVGPPQERAGGAGRVVSVRFSTCQRTQHRRWPRRLSRRLITLIFAGRHRIIVIRREMTRTKREGRARRPAA